MKSFAEMYEEQNAANLEEWLNTAWYSGDTPREEHALVHRIMTLSRGNCDPKAAVAAVRKRIEDPLA